MSVVKVIELLAESGKSWEDATQAAVTEAAKTLDNIQTVYVENFQAIVEGDKVTKYRVNVKISFVVNGSDSKRDTQRETVMEKRMNRM